MIAVAAAVITAMLIAYLVVQSRPEQSERAANKLSQSGTAVFAVVYTATAIVFVTSGDMWLMFIGFVIFSVYAFLFFAFGLHKNVTVPNPSSSGWFR